MAEVPDDKDNEVAEADGKPNVREETEKWLEAVRRVGRGEAIDGVYRLKMFDHDGNFDGGAGLHEEAGTRASILSLSKEEVEALVAIPVNPEQRAEWEKMVEDSKAALRRLCSIDDDNQ